MIKSLLAAVIVGTWNGNWFPSGRAEHRAHPDVEAATVKAVGKMLRSGIDSVDAAGTNDLIICLNEIRGPRVAQELCDAIGRTNLAVAVVTGYRRRDRFDQQQDVILTTLPVAEKKWGLWKPSKDIRAPRGYAMAAIILEPSVTSQVYAVHLKSNYGAKTAESKQANRDKRRIAAEQLAAMTASFSGPVVIAGDFNADKWRSEFKEEKTFSIIENAAFVNLLGLLPPEARGTHPSKRWGDSALDYIFVRGLEPAGAPEVFPAGELSDHSPVFAVLEIP